MWPFQEYLGLGEAYTAKTANAIYTVESRIVYLCEVSYPAELLISNTLLGVTQKKIWSAHSLSVDGRERCRLERISLNFNQNTKRVTVFPNGVFEGLNRACAKEIPDWATLGSTFGDPQC